MPIASLFRAAPSEALALVLAACCAGCDRPGILLCDDCTASLQPAPVDLRTPAGLRVMAALRYEGVVARCVRRLKDEGDTLLARPLGAVLAGVLRAHADAVPRALIVPVPTSRAAFRRRGYRVPDLLVRRAGLRAASVLRSTRAGVDQRGLDAAARIRNVRGSMTARRDLEGRVALLVDDVVTTGATFDEAARVLGAAGCRVVAGVALAATPRHSEH